LNQFDQDIALRPLGDFNFALYIADSWQINVGPNGGYIAAILLHGMKQYLGHIQTRSFTCHFLSASVAGPATLSVNVAKEGRTLSTATTQLKQNGKTIAFAIATFANDRAAPHLNDLSMPVVPPANEIATEDRMSEGSAHFAPFRLKYDQRIAIGPKTGLLSDEAKTGGWTKFSESRNFDDLALLAISDSWFPSIKAKSDSAFHTPTVDHTVHFLAQPQDAECEFLLLMFQTENASNGYLIEDGFIWSDSGCLLARSRQLAILLPTEKGFIT